MDKNTQLFLNTFIFLKKTPIICVRRFTVEGTGSLRVSNLLGQVVLVKEIDGQTTIVLPQGMYFVKLGNEIRKIVVE